jgi:preprotein translocase subunit SecE
VANPIEFIREVRTETAKVVWPTRRETMITTLMVFLMCAFASVFFFLVDRVLGWGVGLILG